MKILLMIDILELLLLDIATKTKRCHIFDNCYDVSYKNDLIHRLCNSDINELPYSFEIKNILSEMQKEYKVLYVV